MSGLSPNLPLQRSGLNKGPGLWRGIDMRRRHIVARVLMQSWPSFEGYR
jgi:hypothetical protein